MLAALAAALRGSDGPGDALREGLVRRLSANEVLLTDSGTSALTLALQIASLDSPGAVALPAYSCYDLATAAVGADVRVRHYDLDPETLEPDLESLRNALERGARTVVAVHLFGFPVDMPAVQALAGEYGAFVIEDAAQALGATVGGRPCGGWGRLSVLSFGRGKGVTGGNGGALVLHDEALRESWRQARRALEPNGRGIRDSAVVAALWALTPPTLYALPANLKSLRLGETLYREPRHAGAISPAAAAAATRSLALSEAEIAVRRRRADWLRERLLGHSRLRTLSPARGIGEAIFLRLPALVTGADPDRVVRSGRALGIARGYPRMLPELPQLRASLLVGRANPGARRLARSLITLPTHSRLARRDVDRLTAWLAAR